MVQFRPLEEAETYFPPPQALIKAASLESEPIRANSQTPVPPLMRLGALTIGVAQADRFEAAGTSDAAHPDTLVARSGPVVTFRTTLEGIEGNLAETWRPRESTEALRSGFGGRGLGALPRPRHFVTEYEPHFRQRTMRRFSQLFERFSCMLGRPETATRLFELKLFMAEVYKESVRNPETRNFATAISLLQDFLHPHWSEISAEKVNEVTGILDWLREQTSVTPRILEMLQKKLSLTLGGLSIESYDDEQESSETHDES